jgi:serine/threonine protein phosphatase PrpC
LCIQVSPVQDVYVHTRTASDVALVIATDGVWDEITNDDGVIVPSTPAARIEVRKWIRRNQWSMAMTMQTRVEEEEPKPADDTEEMMVKCARIADKLLRQALVKGSFDNMAAAVIHLDTDLAVSKRLFGCWTPTPTPTRVRFDSHHQAVNVVHAGSNEEPKAVNTTPHSSSVHSS